MHENEAIGVCFHARAYRSITNPVCVAGGDEGVVESASEPQWSPKGMFSIISGVLSFFIVVQSFRFGTLLLSQAVTFCEIEILYVVAIMVKHLFKCISFWVLSGDLIFVSDRGNGFWNLYSWVYFTSFESSHCFLSFH